MEADMTACTKYTCPFVLGDERLQAHHGHIEGANTRAPVDDEHGGEAHLCRTCSSVSFTTEKGKLTHALVLCEKRRTRIESKVSQDCFELLLGWHEASLLVLHHKKLVNINRCQLRVVFR